MSAGPGASRRVPPVLVGGLLALWLLLNASLSIGHVVLGLVLAIGVAWASFVLRPLQPKLRRGYLAGVLLFVVLRDIVRSNFNVARIVLGLRARPRSARGVREDPADAEGPARSRRPGRASSRRRPVPSGSISIAETSTLTLHVLDLRDEAVWIAWVKDPYERLLREIFE